jgi:outer membrane protein OmpA-like peptidoglycan-associated protein
MLERENDMLRRILMASAGVLLLAACQQQSNQRAAAPMPAASPQNFTVYFDTDQSALTAEARSTVAQAASSFKAGGRAVAVSGHTDTTGPADYNLALSQRRAAAVKAELTGDGVPAGAVAALGYGEQNLPIPTAQNVADRRNRSVDIVISERSAEALMSDTDYCRKLSVLYRRYRTNQIDETAAEAMSKCETTEAARAIPVLEQSLTAMKIALPARTMPRG